MPRIDCVVRCPTNRTFRVEQVVGMFDLSLDKSQSARFSVDLPAEDEDWKIGMIVGPSGSGKSTIAREAFGKRMLGNATWPDDAAVIDGFDEARTIKDITAMLTSVGFSSPPSWVKPYSVLSNGEKFRCDLARALLSEDGLVAFDEFTSVVDRTVAKIGSAAVSKAVRRTPNRKFVAVTCHYDVIDWLEPDWVLDMASGQLARGRLWQRPQIKIRVYRSHHRHWSLFAKHHYLDTKDIPGSVCYVGEWDGHPVAFANVRTNFGHPGQRRISRIVTLPDFQGVGIGTALLDAVADITSRKTGVDKVSIRTGHPAMIQSLKRNPNWSCSEFSKADVRRHTSGTWRAAIGRIVATFCWTGNQTSGTSDSGTLNKAICPT